MYMIYILLFFNCYQEEHKARLKTEKIRIALEKIKEAKIRKVSKITQFLNDSDSAIKNSKVN